MLKCFKSRVWMVLTLLMMVWPQAVMSREIQGSMTQEQGGSVAQSILLLPFVIHSQTGLGHLEHEIPAMLAQQLGRENVRILSYEALLQKISEKKSEEDRKRFFTSSEFLKAISRLEPQDIPDYILSGSLTQIGKRISLDVKLVQPLRKGVPDFFYAEGDGLESLLGLVRELSLDISTMLFKQEKIDQLRVVGNHRIETDAILRVIKTKPDRLFRPGNLTEDLKRVFKMGYFEDVRIEQVKGTEGSIVIFRVKEKPTLRKIEVEGNHVYEIGEILENITLKTGSILQEGAVLSSLKRIENLYKDKNYYNVKVTHQIVAHDDNQVDLIFEITEGDKIRIVEIMFEGISAYSSKDLKKVMKTSEKGLLSWLTSAGDLNMEDLNQDMTRIKAFYQNHGYIEARVAEPEVNFETDGIHITVKIDEGPPYKIGAVDISGDLILSKDELLSRIAITNEEMFNREVIRNDILVLTDIYADEGYARADIYPRIDKKEETLKVDVEYVIQKGKPIYFDRIMITGNTKTRDKVIRRQLKVYEQELYNGRLLKRSTQNLLRLDYFDDVKVTPLPGSADDKMNLEIEVKEKPTGMFSFGGGYSSVESFFLVANITQRNLFGRGQTLGINGMLGGETQRYAVSFLEPWLFDIPLSAFVEIFSWDREYDDYDKESHGGRIRMGYPVYDYTRAYIAYSFEDADVYDIEEDAANSIKELEGNNVSSSLELSLTYDSRDRTFHTTRGFLHDLSVQYAGGPLGGDIAFTKYIGESGWYLPLIWDTVFHIRGKVGYVQKNAGGILPDYEKFYLGGINTLRGYDSQDVCSKDDEGDDVGGEKMVLCNVEFIFPLLEEAGLKGLIFFDTGDVYEEKEDIDFGSLRKTAGYGIRWNSPMGPFRLEYGQILDSEDDENDGGRWEFSIGTTF